ncbi:MULTISPECIES: MaoC/PaaZ C-terminal domain-containing protein [Streptomycetaceae]|uniref:MaoC-like domain-containing protein n=1 Tax=Streptantibioticus cattleyicolor (strain ATCC 35852 / DSM 46488 / JCM 4925 / NBRC 14057 / NRRL 8057) TaxID=1003195 RepID=F8JR63_STREN|nr:MaoC/PaaZ C-terminal domain-containing protein [Streptantibioticus cattleyicolor]AEW95361.1 hypothetical protein SCATT_29900 [Streptantibioticus cattleyicolor NRRL 8057 = DSM 46488]MYS59935.1 acyl dehydratase [Streptomyces sp. SID5468]CCB75703.1 conserved protein of unknown function [Streptantibioticus cattleyicolor NRRL 8057 = DSM 46488]
MRPGDELPPLRVPITCTLIVAGAIATRDYQDVHHDAEAARAKGSPDIFMNILTTNGLVGRYVTEYVTGRTGAAATLRAVRIRLGAPNYPGDEMVLTGKVTEVTGATAEIEVTGRNAIGNHVTGRVTVALPVGSTAGADGTAGLPATSTPGASEDAPASGAGVEPAAGAAVEGAPR